MQSDLQWSFFRVKKGKVKMIKYFNVPADFKNDTIDQYAKMNEQFTDSQVIETYGQVTIDNCIGSGRAYDLLPRIDMDRLKAYIAYSKERGIGFNYTLNTTCMGNMEFTKEGIDRIVHFLDELYNIGVRSLTVTLPPLMEIIRQHEYDFEIKSSTVCQVVNANKAMSYKKLGVDKIVIDESINRDFEALKNIRNAFGDKVEIITNVICHKNCIYEMFHHNQTSHDSGVYTEEPSTTYYSHRCIMKRCESPVNILKMAFIRPEDLVYYTDIGIHYFKLQGRQAAMDGDMVRGVEHYMKGDFDGNLMELLDMFSPTNSFHIYVDNKKLDGFIKPFVNKHGFCKNDCTTCKYCENFAKEHLEYDRIDKVFHLAENFYSQYDQFTNMVRDAKIKK